MNIVQLNNFIEKIVSCTEIVKSFYTDSVYECWNAEEVKYGSISFCITKTQMRERTMTYTAMIYYGDRLMEDKSNRNAIWSDASQVIQSIIGIVNGLDGEITISYPYDLTLFEQKFADELAGAYAEIDIEVEGIGECGDLLYGYEGSTEDIKLESVVKVFTVNGEYDIIPSDGFDAISDVKVVVDVPLQMGVYGLRSNGRSIIEPDPGYEGFKTVEVDVEVPIQSKSVEFNSNGVYDVVPDSGYDAMDNVEVNVNIPFQSKSVEFNSNGVYDVVPDSGYDAMDNVEVNVNIPLQSKSVIYSEVGDYEVIPDPGYEALSKVDVKVSLEGKTRIPNGFRFTGGDMSLVEWDKYDWSMVYDTTGFFGNCTSSDPNWFERFKNGFNGKLMSCDSIFSSFKFNPNGDEGVGIDFTGIDTSNVVSYEYAFYSTNGWMGPYFVRGIDTSNALNFGYMFYNCGKLTEVPQLDTSQGVLFSNMFYNCGKLTEVPQLDTSNAWDLSEMFSGCSKLTEVPQLDTSNARIINQMFQSCYELVEIPYIDTHNATNMRSLFSGCKLITSIPELDISNVENMESTFFGCSKLIEVRLKGNPSKLTKVTDMFKNVNTDGVLYYDSRYDYSKIINVLPSTWTAIPYDVVE